MSEKEYIERGAVKEKLAAMRHAMVAIYGSGIGNLSANTIDAMQSNINAIPTADVEPVVRCCKCSNSSAKCQNSIYCEVLHFYHSENFYCAHGKERER